jgi:hypothetical protein
MSNNLQAATSKQQHGKRISNMPVAPLKQRQEKNEQQFTSCSIKVAS